jgi:alginate O-acetyltransferase complex protein AlgI
MLFSSPPYLVFFAAYFLLHVLVPVRLRIALVIAGSTIFYAYWNPYYAWLPFFLIAIAYGGSTWTMAAPAGPARRSRLVVAVAVLLLPLAAVKYTAFVANEVLHPLLGMPPPVAPWPLPLGISFVTFTLIAYVVDVYRGRYPLERNVAMLAGLVLFFPHLIAGPILRPAELLPQLQEPKPALPAPWALGLSIFTLGLVKKLVFADSFAEVVQRAFDPAGGPGLSSPDYLLAIYGFALQIYCDFSGYTDMAIGSALLLGIRLPRNFDRPYAAASIVEFWRRWHITLSRWLRDYLYIPLGGNRRGYPRQVLNLLVTMALGGLWHGAHWTFVAWGVAHGAALAVVHTLRRVRPLRPITRMPRWLGVLVTFHVVAALWILFRAPDAATALRVARGPFVAPAGDVGAFAAANAFPLVLLAVFFALHRWDYHATARWAARRVPAAVLWPVLALGWLLAIAISQGSSAKFIYFDF